MVEMTCYHIFYGASGKNLLLRSSFKRQADENLFNLRQLFDTIIEGPESYFQMYFVIAQIYFRRYCAEIYKTQWRIQNLIANNLQAKTRFF